MAGVPLPWHAPAVTVTATTPKDIDCVIFAMDPNIEWLILGDFSVAMVDEPVSQNYVVQNVVLRCVPLFRNRTRCPCESNKRPPSLNILCRWTVVWKSGIPGAELGSADRLCAEDDVGLHGLRGNDVRNILQ